jgi:hypothetical protein
MGPQKSRELYRVGAGGSNRRGFGPKGPEWPLRRDLGANFHNAWAGLARGTNPWRASQGIAPVRPILGTMAHSLSAA